MIVIERNESDMTSKAAILGYIEKEFDFIC